jgi:hypothetical protein
VLTQRREREREKERPRGHIVREKDGVDTQRALQLRYALELEGRREIGRAEIKYNIWWII